MFEYLGGYKEDERLASIALVAETVNYLEVSLSAGSKPTRKAPSWIIIVVIALELYVMSERAEYLRFTAATELLKGFWYGTQRRYGRSANKHNKVHH